MESNLWKLYWKLIKKKPTIFGVKVLSAFNPVDNPALRVDGGGGASQQHQLLFNQQMSPKEILICFGQEEEPGKGRSASRSSEHSAVACCADSSAPATKNMTRIEPPSKMSLMSPGQPRWAGEQGERQQGRLPG